MRPFRLAAVLLQLLLSWNAVFADTALKEGIRRLAAPYIEGQVVMGLAAGVIQGDQVETLGMGRLSQNDPRIPNEQTIFEIGSVSKLFTAALLADSVRRGEVTLDQPIQELLPPDLQLPVVDDQPVRLVHLATHASGLPRLPANFLPQHPSNPYADYDKEKLYAALRQLRPQRPPGTKLEYSNLGAGLLGHLLELKTRQSYAELLRTRIATVLAMSDTVVNLSPEQAQRLAPPHADVDTPTVGWRFDVLVGAGGIHSTIQDMVKFLQAHLKPSDSPLGPVFESVWKVHQQPITSGDFAMGLGWHVARDQQTRWHNGQTGGYHSIVLANRELGLGVVLLAHTAAGEIDLLGEDVMRFLAGAEVTPRSFERPVVVAPEVMRRYVGKYRLAPNFEFTVSVDDGKLMVGVTGQPTLRVYPRSETEWFYREVEASLKFNMDERGKCISLELFQHGVRQTAPRVEGP